MSFNIALTGLNAANQDLNVTANNLANVVLHRLQELARRVRRPVRLDPARRQPHGRRQRCVSQRSRAAVHPGQHRDDRQQPGPRDQRQRLLHAEQRWRPELHPRRRVPDGPERQRRQLAGREPPGLSAPGHRRLQHRRPAESVTDHQRKRPEATTTAKITANLPASATAPPIRPSARPTRTATPTPRR